MKADPRLVVDTSALIDGAEIEQTTWREAFTYLSGAYEVQAPGLITLEVGNIVHHKHPEVFGVDQGDRSKVRGILLSGIQTAPTSEKGLDRCGRLAEEAELTFYDARFLELAMRREETILLTHDRGLREAGRERLGSDRCLTLDEAARAIAEGEL